LRNVKGEKVYEHDFHNLNGFASSFVTHESMMKVMKKVQPFVLTRSTFFGSGQFAFHWSGDNFASWEFLRFSLSELFNF